MEAKRVFLTTLTCLCVFFLAMGLFFGNSGSVNADTKDFYTKINEDTPDFLKENFNDKYGIIKIKDKLDNKIVEYSLIKNTEQCTTECSAEGRAILYDKGKLFDDIEFVDSNYNKVSISNTQYWIKIDEEYEVDVLSKYEEVCEINSKGTLCYDAPSKYKKEKAIRQVWIEYNYEELDAGNYEWKLTGGKDSTANIDFQIISNGETLTEWAWWNGTGGTITYDGDYTVVTFTGSGNFNWSGDSKNAEVLVVAGGGGGGGSTGGGGGAGGLLYNSSFPLTEQIYSITIGTGGSGGAYNSAPGSNGGNSVFSTMTAVGGGGGGSYSNQAPTTGGSGGGGYQGTVSGAAGTAGQGYAGGNGGSSSSSAGGGGGSSEVGTNANTGVPGDGGDGTAYNISGSSVYYGGGGGGAAYTGGSGSPGTGGLGGGGNGGDAGESTTESTDGAANTGGGGGGGGNTPSTGGTGIVIIRYLTYEEVLCPFSGYVFDEDDNALEGANVTIWNQYNVTEYYEATTNSSGIWTADVENGTNTYMAGAYYNNTLIGQLKPYISGLC